MAVSVSTSTFGAQLLDALLVLHAEALLLVDDEQPEVLELDVVGEQAVRADDDVDRAVLDAARRPSFCSFGDEEPRQHLDPHRVVGEALAERLAVLAREQRGRHEHATCLPSCTALNAARTATSVLP